MTTGRAAPHRPLRLRSRRCRHDGLCQRDPLRIGVRADEAVHERPRLRGVLHRRQQRRTDNIRLGSALVLSLQSEKRSLRAAELAGSGEPSPAHWRQARAEVAQQFDEVHSVDRAFEVGSVDAVISASEVRPAVIAELHTAALAQLVS